MVTCLAEFSFQPLHNSPESAERDICGGSISCRPGLGLGGELLVKQQFQTHPTFCAHLHLLEAEVGSGDGQELVGKFEYSSFKFLRGLFD